MRPLIRMVVPAYFHPGVAPDDWRRLASARTRPRLVVLNLADGPGSVRDAQFAAVVDPLVAAGVPVAGYLDTAYGERAKDALLRDAARYRRWYGVDRVFLDRVRADRAGLPHYAGAVTALRDDGAVEVTMNPGVYPDLGYVELADLVVTFEGPWRSYRRLVVPSWAHCLPAQRFCHLVYGAPRLARWRARRLAARRHVGFVTTTAVDGANPWRRLPAPWR
ncbi:Spherulation-specific family 4 [Streptoalloteichus tenebrarius]|uniref:Spherulation-specific family 4 n=1 Tax=Streptoalloteichus tenebrarius (strain ATCC 17920 / DSM 40477 / JCM 4838 / CBS 697.72 / NBRC 16177 / NCIMB 11028 / NRRL B-12390 / A12253. 1 / ISP 5477) TaxID=1933 RepID=A0ABT1HQU5_STRSD|nr:spherulation-specific family 4 protein [Streptoalloteichus tenebrarius]MCP2257895.1 Spherulation-specific family 4 [Streptoalloteichus tenebrarius]BFE99742.1 spherulation-specific family 4 protein [Streptoalloteichus tenebrarius]